MIVVVQGQVYEFDNLSEMTSVTLLRAVALKKHGIINYKQSKTLDETWEVRTPDGHLVSPARFLAELEGVTTLHINLRPGWGG